MWNAIAYRESVASAMERCVVLTQTLYWSKYIGTVITLHYIGASYCLIQELISLRWSKHYEKARFHWIMLKQASHRIPSIGLKRSVALQQQMLNWNERFIEAVQKSNCAACFNWVSTTYRHWRMDYTIASSRFRWIYYWSLRYIIEYCKLIIPKCFCALICSGNERPEDQCFH